MPTFIESGFGVMYMITLTLLDPKPKPLMGTRLESPNYLG